ncbi:beta-defensin 119 isoform X3 [Oryctolagus cuniculus]|uniref:beta-defensin 119 isoform X3 n=1 Tax=Oryctolagus cuniculus TaxID=9986 RepID=UPI0007EE6331|nr:beta-defensin 119 isoform X3 [Oryctolagus cuniculus]
MKLLFLSLAILLAMEPVMPGRRSSERCMGNSGICRSSCKKNEQPYFFCRNYQSCCLQSYVRISVSGPKESNEWSYEKHWPDIP